MSKRGDFDFEWLFAIIAGAAILLIAIYGASKIGDTARYQTDTETAKQIGIITDPLEAGFAEGSFGKIIFNQETIINNECYSDGFGRNDISISSRSGVGKEWSNFGGAVSAKSKYIFSKKEQGKEFYVFSKPFYMSFKVADMIFLNSKKYCFISSSATKDIEDELTGLNMPNIKVGNATSCSNDSIRVCFNSKCEISVYGTCSNYNCNNEFEEGYVEKNGERMNYVGNLMYAAIFSDKDIYDCNVKRLLYRTGMIAEVLSGKADLMNARNCNTNLKEDLDFLSSQAKNSSDVSSINVLAKNLENKRTEVCGLY